MFALSAAPRCPRGGHGGGIHTRPGQSLVRQQFRVDGDVVWSSVFLFSVFRVYARAPMCPAAGHPESRHPKGRGDDVAPPAPRPERHRGSGALPEYLVTFPIIEGGSS